MANIIDTFKDHFRNVTGMTTDEAMSSLKVQDDVTARSGKNITMGDNIVPITGVGNKYGKVLKDAIKFYQDEFKVTPRANIIFDPDELGEIDALGAASPWKNISGQHIVDLLNLSDEDAAADQNYAKISAETGWHPKGSGTIAHTPVHELGHVLTFQLFPSEDDVYKLYEDSINDISDWKNVDERAKKTTEISEYANSSPYETVAEALVDYYHNRENSAQLSKAIVKRLKNKGSLYGLTQSGGVRTPNETFAQNLRRYQAIQ